MVCLVCSIPTSSFSRKGSDTPFEFRHPCLSIVSSFSNASNYCMDEQECGPDTFNSYMGLYIEMYLLTFDGVFFFLWTIIIELLIMAASMGHRGHH